MSQKKVGSTSTITNRHQGDNNVENNPYQATCSTLHLVIETPRIVPLPHAKETIIAWLYVRP